jgi:hypothetical protein
MKRFVLISLIIVSLLVIASGLVVRVYLRSSRVAQQITQRLETIYGGPVRIGEVDVGLNSTAIDGLALFETGAETNGDDPWLKIVSLTADVSLWDVLAQDAMPEKVTFRGAVFVLRFNRAGDLLTRLPAMPQTAGASAASFPEIEIENGEVIFRKEGQTDFVIKKLRIRLNNDGSTLVLSGEGDSADLGKLVLSGSLEKEAGRATIHLETQTTAHVTQTILNQVPFVPGSLWNEIQIAEADTTAKLTLRYDLNNNGLHYRLELVAQNAKVFVPSIDLQTHDAKGKVTIDDNQVLLREIVGQALGGQLHVEADLDFRGAESQLRFTKIEVKDLKVSDLSEDWNLPAVVRKTVTNGRLTGDATLEVTIFPAKVTGADAGTLIAMMAVPPGLASAPCWAPAGLLTVFPESEIRTKSHGKGQVRDPAGQAEPIDFDWRFVPKRFRSRRSASETGPRPGEAEQFFGNVAERIMSLLFREAKKAAQEPNGAAKYVDVNLDIKDADLADIIKNLDFTLPFSLEGKVSFKIKASLSVDGIKNAKVHKAEGSVHVTQLVLAGVKLAQVNADLVYADGVLHLKSLKGQVAQAMAGADTGGTFQGSGQLEYAPLGELRADLNMDRVAIGKLLGLDTADLTGEISGKLTLHARADKLYSVKAIVADGNLHSERVQAFGLTLEKVGTSVRLKDGVLKLPDWQGTVEGTSVAATAELRLGGDYAFQGKTNLRDWNLAALQKVAATKKLAALTVAGVLTTSVALKGRLNPYELSASGDARAQRLKIDAFEADDVKFHWNTDGDQVALNDVEAMLYGGKVTGTAVLPIRPYRPGKLDLSIHELEVKRLAQHLHLPFGIEGHVTGLLKGTLPPVAEGQVRTAALTLDVKSPKMRVVNIPAEQLHGTIDYQKGSIDYKLEGKTLGGVFDLEGQIPIGPKKAESKKGKLSIQKVQVGKFFNALGMPNIKELKGELHIEVEFSHDTPDRIPEGKGKLWIDNLRFKDVLSAHILKGDILLSNNELRVRNLTGSIAQGTYRAQATYFLKEPARSWFSVSIDRAEAGQILAPWLGGSIDGLLQAHLRGKLGGDWSGSADVELARGKIFGLEVTQWNLPVTWSFAPGQGRFQIDVHETEAHVARGRVKGKMHFAWEHSARVKGSLSFSNVDLREFLRSALGSTEVGGGQMTGRFDFSGDDVRSLKDLGGNLVVSLSQSQSLRLPVLSQVAPILGLGAATTFQNGELRARLARGELRIQRFTLENNNLQLFIDGAVSLEGRLNLGVVAKVGNLGVPTERLRLLGMRIPEAGPVPIPVLREATNLLSKRLLSVEVTGTVRSPVIQPRTLPLLTSEVVRFFVGPRP